MLKWLCQDIILAMCLFDRGWYGPGMIELHDLSHVPKNIHRKLSRAGRMITVMIVIVSHNHRIVQFPHAVGAGSTDRDKIRPLSILLISYQHDSPPVNHQQTFSSFRVNEGREASKTTTPLRPISTHLLTSQASFLRKRGTLGNVGRRVSFVYQHFHMEVLRKSLQSQIIPQKMALSRDSTFKSSIEIITYSKIY